MGELKQNFSAREGCVIRMLLSLLRHIHSHLMSSRCFLLSRENQSHGALISNWKGLIGIPVINSDEARMTSPLLRLVNGMETKG